MHASVMRWFSAALAPSEVAGRRVLEVGSYNVNGSVRPLVEAHGPAAYLGVDQTPGPGVDRLVGCADLVSTFGPGSWDVVISTEMLEHVEDWWECVAQLCEVVATGGLLVLTTRSPGFPYHPYPIDTWRYPVPVMRDILDAAELTPLLVVDDPDPKSPGVFAMATKPEGWAAPWRDRGLAGVFAGLGVVAVVKP